MQEYEKYGNNCMQIAKVLSTRTPAQIKKYAECFFKQNLKTNSAAVKRYRESLSPNGKAQVLVKNGLAGNVGDMSAACCRRVKMSPIFAQNACRCRHQNSPNTEFCFGFLATLYHIPKSYIRTNTHTKNLGTHKDPLPLPKK